MKRPIINNEIATTRKDIDLFGGYISRLENPDPVLRTEAGGKGLRLYDEIDGDSHAGGVLETRYLAVIGKEWEVLPASERPRDRKVAEFVKSALLDTNFDQARQELYQAILYGYYVSEIIWGRNASGQIVIKKFIGKHPRRFSFDYDRNLRLLTPENMIDGDPVPDRKFIAFTYGSSDNPYGKGLGRSLWWPVWFKKNGVRFWLIFLEKFGSPTVVGKYPPGTDQATQQKLLEAIDAIQQETGIKIPASMSVELMEATRGGSASYEQFCAYWDKQISKRVLGQTLTTEVGDKGSYAASQTHEGVRQDILKADADLQCEVLNATLVRWLVDFNFAGVTAYPKIWVRTESAGDQKSLAERDKILKVDIGLPMPDNYFYEAYDIPVPGEGDRISVADNRQVSVGDAPESASFAEPRPRFSFADSDAVADQAALKAQAEFVRGLTDRIAEMAAQAGSHEEIGERLYEMFPDLDTGRFQELLGRAMRMSAIMGYASAETEQK